MIYLDNAATSGVKPKSVIKAVYNALINLSANPGRGGHRKSIESATSIFNVRSKLSKMFNAESENSVIFTANCTTSINILLNGVLNSGDHIIVSSLEHNAVMRPLNNLAVTKGISYDIVKINVNEPEKSIVQFKNKIRNNTKMIFTTHASNVTGTLMPIKEIGRLCRAEGILFGVDAAQSAGVINIDMKECSIDYLCIASHKGLFAPMGTGVLIADKPIDNPFILGGTGVNSISLEQPDSLPERVESGTLNVPGICGIGAGIDFLNSHNKSKILQREKELLGYLYQMLKRLNAEIYTENPMGAQFVPVLSFNIKNRQSEETADYLGKNMIAVRGGLHCAPFAHRTIGTLERGTVRISPSFFNTPEEMEKAVFLLKKF